MILDITAEVPITLPVDVEMGPHVDEGPDVVLAGRDMKLTIQMLFEISDY